MILPFLVLIVTAQDNLAPNSAAASEPLVRSRDCTTYCGLQTKDFKCFEVQALETLSLKAFSKFVKEFPPLQACTMLNGWRLILHSARIAEDKKVCTRGGWNLFADYKKKYGVDEKPFCVAAVTNESDKTIEIGKDEALFHVFTHEIAHALDAEFNIRPLGHCHWDKRGIKRAILDVTGIPDLTPDRTPDSPDCPED